MIAADNRVSTTPAMPFVDLATQRARLGPRLDEAIAGVLDHGQFILGPEVRELEERLAAYSGVGHAISCSSGTDALVLTLLALGIGRGDAVVVPSFTFAATAEAVALVGATPVFADVSPSTFTIDAASARSALDGLATTSLMPRAVIAVDLFGHPADYDSIIPLCEDWQLSLIVDAAQSYGATWRGRRAGSIGDVVVTSFFPSKPLGCYGDGGAVFTDHGEIARAVRSLRVHGMGTDKYENVRIGLNARLDTIQAAILIAKLEIFDDELGARQRASERYGAGLADLVEIPVVDPAATTTWAQYTIQTNHRERLIRHLHQRGVPTAVHYRVPLHRQPAYRDFPVAPAGMGVSDGLRSRVLSLPLHPYLTADVQATVIAAIEEALA